MQLEFWKIAVLAVVQGVTEFLPISSDGHLLVAAALMSPDGSVQGIELSDITIVLHLGTLLSILVFYWPRILQLLTADRRTIGLLIVGTLPAVAFGLPIKQSDRLEKAVLENELLGGAMLIVSGLVLIWAARQTRGDRRHQDLTMRETIVIGIAQSLAILPGLSRSGMTIATGLRMRLAPESAATFSFLLAIPAIGGAGVLALKDIVLDGQEMVTPVPHLVAGAGISFVVGLLSLGVLVRMLERGRLQWFAAWCIPLGIAVLLWQLSLRMARS